MTGQNAPKLDFRRFVISLSASLATLALAASGPAAAETNPPATTAQAGNPGAETSGQAAQNQPRLTFPPTSDCTFLGGDAQKRCEDRRAGAENEYARVRSGKIKLSPGVPSSSGGELTPFSNSGSLGGFSESQTIPSGGEPAPSAKPFNPNSIGNPWAGTPYDNGTGIPPR
ncbi:MAG TPA: hypothetical protein VND94_20490 [Terriglobia bacterium]|nr:hypothetical protein [Terriglobia bacterium]